MSKMLNYDQQMKWQSVKNYLQSPIDIRSADVVNGKQAFSFEVYEPLMLTQVENLGNNLKFIGHGAAKILHRPYQFQQVHFHHPSEHLINGQAAAFEVHFVFESSIGQTLVLALLFRVGKVSPLIQKLIKQSSFQVNLSLPTDGISYHYLGSLTTPPLQPGTEWLVITADELTLSQVQLDWFIEHFPANARQVQSLEKRPIEGLKM